MRLPPAIVQAPSNLGLGPTGVERLGDALIEAGLACALKVGAIRRADPPARDGRRDPGTGVLNAPAIAAYSVRLADVVGETLNAGMCPVVLGGDCSILLGDALALRRRGRFGLLFLDGHADFYQPEAEPNGEAASMDLALATGRGPPLLADLEGRRPLVRDGDAVAFGHRDGEEAAANGSQALPPDLPSIGLDDIRSDGLPACLARALAVVARPDLDGFWLHLDLDVLDDAVMPAVDYRLPGGLGWDELATVLREALGTGRCVGMEVTIFNPTLDHDGALARGVVNLLANAVGT